MIFVVALAFSLLVVGALAVFIWNDQGSDGEAGGQLGEWGGGQPGQPGPGQGRLLATLDRGPLDMLIRRGSGAQRGVDRPSKVYGSRPFPIDNGGVVVTFEIMFMPNFEWGCRGKIGGLMIGPNEASGCRHFADSASHRLMWDRDGGAFSYVYVPQGTNNRQPAPLNQYRNCGLGVFESDFRRALTTNKWHRIQLATRLNTPGSSDGALMLSVDGKARTLRGVTWRTGNQGIRSLSFGIFHGGGCVATRDSRLSIRNVDVHVWEV